jgi:hypothetical protein
MSRQQRHLTAAGAALSRPPFYSHSMSALPRRGRVSRQLPMMDRSSSRRRAAPARYRVVCNLRLDIAGRSLPCGPRWRFGQAQQ